MSDIICPKISYLLTGYCFEAHNKLGRFLSERQYADELERILNAKQIDFQREYELTNLSKDIPQGSRVDFLINSPEGQIILEIKAKRLISKEDFYQMLRYLKSTNIKLGLIVNFRNRYIKPKRVINM